MSGRHNYASLDDDPISFEEESRFHTAAAKACDLLLGALIANHPGPPADVVIDRRDLDERPWRGGRGSIGSVGSPASMCADG